MNCPYGLYPIRQLFKAHLLTLPGEGDTAGKEHRGGTLVFRAVFVVTDQGEAPGGKLHPDLVAAAGVKPDAHQGLVARLRATFEF